MTNETQDAAHHGEDAQPEFVLDRTENPHPRMLQRALVFRDAANNDPHNVAMGAYWLGYREAMCDATGEAPLAIEGWMTRNDDRPLPERTPTGVAVELGRKK